MKAARLWTIRIKPGEQDALFRALKEISLPMLRSQPGFQGLYLFRTRENRQEISYLTLWADASKMETAVRSARWQQALKQFAARRFQLGKPRISHHDIIAEEPAP